MFLGSSAEIELEESKDYYNAERPGLGEEFLNEVEAAFYFIQKNPEIWPLSKDKTRRCSLDRFPFRVVYRIQNNTIEIISVAHFKRRPGYWKNRL